MNWNSRITKLKSSRACYKQKDRDSRTWDKNCRYKSNKLGLDSFSPFFFFFNSTGVHTINGEYERKGHWV